MDSFDVITLGAGAACYPAAFKIKRSGGEVLIVDRKGVMSGNCLSEGCIPSKAVIETVHSYIRSRRFADFEIEYGDILKHKDSVQNRRYADHEEDLKKAGLNIVKGEARIIDENTIEVISQNDRKRYHTEHLIIGTGSEPFIPRLPGIEYAITSRELFSINPAVTRVPETIAIIGGGYIGVETGAFLSLLGSRVTVIEMLDRVLSTMDRTMTEKLIPLLPPMNYHLKSTVKSIEKLGDKFIVNYEKEGKPEKVTVDLVMISVGRIPVFPEGLDNIGLLHDRRGIKVNSAMQTNVKGIYATGDVNGILPLAHAAKRQSLVAANNILADNEPVDSFDPVSVPNTVFTIPQMAYVGILPEKARQMGISYKETDYPMSHDVISQIHDELSGELRLFADESMKVIGGYVIGNDAANVINEISLAVSKGLTLKDLADLSHQHPMTFEGLDIAARKLY